MFLLFSIQWLRLQLNAGSFNLQKSGFRIKDCFTHCTSSIQANPRGSLSFATSANCQLTFSTVNPLPVQLNTLNLNKLFKLALQRALSYSTLCSTLSSTNQLLHTILVKLSNLSTLVKKKFIVYENEDMPKRKKKLKFNWTFKEILVYKFFM